MLERMPIGPVPVGDVIEAWIGHPSEQMREGRHSDFWRVHPGGLLYEIRSLDEDFTEKAKPGTTIDLTIPIWRVGETLLYIARLARLMGTDPEIAIRIRYNGLKNRSLRSLFSHMYISFERQCFTDKVQLTGKTRTSTIEDNLTEVLFQLLSPFTMLSISLR